MAAGDGSSGKRPVTRSDPGKSMVTTVRPNPFKIRRWQRDEKLHLPHFCSAAKPITMVVLLPESDPSTRHLLRHRFRPTTATTSRRPSASIRHFLHPADLRHRSGGHAPSADQSIDRPPPFKIQRPSSSDRRFTCQQWPTKQSAHP
ncbi:hypothetical protein ACLOJK_006870 [Asimina triloba]